MKIDVFTLFPEWFEWFRSQRHVTNALELGSELRTFNYRDSSTLSGNVVDDTPYGGGAGMVLRVDIVDQALGDAYGDERPARKILLAPSGRQFDDAMASELAGEDHVALLCGRYEGVDHRVREHLVDDVVSIGPYVLSGGELAAMVIADAVLRKLPGALGTRRQRDRGVVLRGARGRARVPAVHASRELPGVGRAGDPAVRRPRPDP